MTTLMDLLVIGTGVDDNVYTVTNKRIEALNKVIEEIDKQFKELKEVIRSIAIVVLAHEHEHIKAKDAT